MAIVLSDEESGWDVQAEPEKVVLILGDYIFELTSEEAIDIGVRLICEGEDVEAETASNAEAVPSDQGKG